METPIFDTGFEKSRKFCVRNDIIKFVIVTLRRYTQGHIVKKCSKLFIRISEEFGNNKR